MPSHRYTHTRILQLVACPSPLWAVFYDDSPTETGPLFECRIHCFALVEVWENYRAVSICPQADDEPYQIIRPVTNYADEIEPVDSSNLVDIVSEWPLSTEDHARLLASSVRKS
jgi:hypothetical protein